MTSRVFEELVSALAQLPGVGRKTALRLAFYLVDHRELAGELSRALEAVYDKVRECDMCRNLTQSELCEICSDRSRTASICVVESPADLRSIEDAGLFRGRYFVLHGLLAPLDGVGPEELGIDKLLDMVRETEAEEAILALDATAEGEATCSYLARALEPKVAQVTRLARGLPSGASVEFADELTLSQAFEGRRKA